MGHVTKSASQRVLPDRQCLWLRLGIEGVWKLSIKGSQVPWTGVDKGQEALALFTALPRYCCMTLGEFLCASVSWRHHLGLGEEDKGFRRCMRREMLSGEWKERGVLETQIRTTCLHTKLGC